MLDFKKIVALAKAQGFRVTQTEGGHWRFVPPLPKNPIVVTSGTPSDHRTIDNFIARLRRSGFSDGVHGVRHG